MKEKKRIIRLVAVKKLYKKHALSLLAPELNGKYFTGQESIPLGDKSDLGLTTDQMLGKVELTAQQKKDDRLQYVINPLNTLKFPDGFKFDMSTPEGIAKYNFITQKHFPEIAKSKLEFNKSKHTHYLEDKEADAAKEVSRDDAWFEARKLVADLSKEKLIQLAMLLRYTVKSFNINPTGASMDILLKNIYSLCKENPDAIKQCFKEHNPHIDKLLFVVELLSYGILVQKGSNIYDGNNYIAGGVDGVLEYISKATNSADYSRWGKELLNKRPENK